VELKVFLNRPSEHLQRYENVLEAIVKDEGLSVIIAQDERAHTDNGARTHRQARDVSSSTHSTPVAQYPGASRNEGPILFIPGGGLTRRILSYIPESWQVPTAALVQFVLEGNNSSNASLVAAVVAKVFSLEVQQWRVYFRTLSKLVRLGACRVVASST
jgi:hypothetical protein